MAHLEPRLEGEVQKLINKLKNKRSTVTKAVFQATDLLLKEGVKELMEALTQNTHLEFLTLTGMELTDDQATMLISVVREHPRLRELNVTKNNFSASFIETLIKSTMSKEVMRVLHIGKQAEPLTPEEEEMILKAIEENTCLHVCTVNVTNPEYVRRINTRLTTNARLRR